MYIAWRHLCVVPYVPDSGMGGLTMLKSTDVQFTFQHYRSGRAKMSVKMTIAMGIPSVEHTQVPRIVDIKDGSPVAYRVRKIFFLLIMDPHQAFVIKQIMFNRYCCFRSIISIAESMMEVSLSQSTRQAGPVMICWANRAYQRSASCQYVEAVNDAIWPWINGILERSCDITNREGFPSDH